MMDATTRAMFGPPTAEQVEIVFCYVRLSDRISWIYEEAMQASCEGDDAADRAAMARANGLLRITNRLAKAPHADPPPGFCFMSAESWLDDHTKEHRHG